MQPKRNCINSILPKSGKFHNQVGGQKHVLCPSTMHHWKHFQFECSNSNFLKKQTTDFHKKKKKLRKLSTSTTPLRFLVDIVTAERQLPLVYCKWWKFSFQHLSSVKVFICEWKSDSSVEEECSTAVTTPNKFRGQQHAGLERQTDKKKRNGNDGMAQRERERRSV